MGRKGSICHFSRALPAASIWGHYCSQVLVLLAFEAHRKGHDNDTLRAASPSIGILGPPNIAKQRGNAK